MLFLCTQRGWRGCLLLGAQRGWLGGPEGGRQLSWFKANPTAGSVRALGAPGLLCNLAGGPSSVIFRLPRSMEFQQAWRTEHREPTGISPQNRTACRKTKIINIWTYYPVSRLASNASCYQTCHYYGKVDHETAGCRRCSPRLPSWYFTRVIILMTVMKAARVDWILPVCQADY